MEFAGKRALVTGAGKGIGRDLVHGLIARGATVIALSRSGDDLHSLRAETGCETIVADLEDAEAAVQALRPLLPVHLLVNNAGIALLQPALETTEAGFFRVMRVNAWAALRMAQAVAGDLVGRGEGGAIVNVSSIAAGVGLADHAAYCASKAALDAITRVLAVEWGRHGIRTNAVNPAVTLTPMAELAWSDPAKAAPMQSRIPMGRFVQPREVADAVCFLLGAGAAMINGVCLDVDGGFRAG